MSTIEKLIKRMLTIPKDFESSELDRIMNHFGYQRFSGKGSGLKYYRESDKSMINFHLPHGANSENALKAYVIRQAIDELKKRGDIK